MWQVVNEHMLSRLHIFELGCFTIEIEIVYKNQNRTLDINVLIPSSTIYKRWKIITFNCGRKLLHSPAIKDLKPNILIAFALVMCSHELKLIWSVHNTMSLDPNPRIYQALRGIKCLEVKTFSQVLQERIYLRRGLHLCKFDPCRCLIDPRIWNSQFLYWPNLLTKCTTIVD